jgi:hypothetical protein
LGDSEDIISAATADAADMGDVAAATDDPCPPSVRLINSSFSFIASFFLNLFLLRRNEPFSNMLYESGSRLQ